MFVGAGRVVEQRLVGEQGFEQRTLPVESTRTLMRNPPKFLWRNWQAYRQAVRLLEEVHPRAVVGLGGFASVPLVLAASRRNVPTLLLEQNVIPGRATRWLSRHVDAVCTSFEDTREHLPQNARVEVTGNPVRPEIADLFQRNSDHVQPASDLSHRGTLLVLGGSQGASAINDAMVEFVKREETKLAGWHVVHQTGRDQCEQVRRAYAETRVELIVEPFFDDMAALYRETKLVVSRAGATTLAELACAGCPAILIPYPHAADNHQWHNARVYEAAGAARLIVQEDPHNTTKRLTEELLPLLSDASRLEAMRDVMRSIARPDATQRVVETLYSALNTKC